MSVLPAGLAALALCATPLTAADLTYVLTSASETRSYGLLLAAPDTGCGRVRYAVTGAGGLLGRSPALRPGEVSVIRMGAGFRPGDHVLRILTSGCTSDPPRARRVTLAKPSPDHGWRAGN